MTKHNKRVLGQTNTLEFKHLRRERLADENH
jgi:hypothetical protein